MCTPYRDSIDEETETILRGRGSMLVTWGETPLRTPPLLIFNAKDDTRFNLPKVVRLQISCRLYARAAPLLKFHCRGGNPCRNIHFFENGYLRSKCFRGRGLNRLGKKKKKERNGRSLNLSSHYLSFRLSPPPRS